jgi:2-isopropylmalate synthase
MIYLYDTTLRDGTQAEGIQFSAADKVRIAQRLDEFGIHYIEGGWPGSNPRDIEFFHLIHNEKLKQAKVAAFGSTRHNKYKASEDPNLAALLEARCPVVTIFGKSWDLHVTKALRVSFEDNLKMITDSVRYLKSKKLEVIYDAEHFRRLQSQSRLRLNNGRGGGRGGGGMHCALRHEWRQFALGSGGDHRCGQGERESARRDSYP